MSNNDTSQENTDEEAKKPQCAFCYYARFFFVGVLGLALAWLLMTDWFLSTCRGGCADVVGVLVWPASWVGQSFSGEGEMVGTYFAIGMIFQFWLIYLWVDAILANKRSN